MREVQATDFSRIIAIYKANQNLPGAPSWTEQQLTDECRESESQVMRSAIGEVVAFVLYRKTPDAFEISYLATDPKAKRQGHMARLLRALFDHATQSNLKIWLEVHEDNLAARSLYEKLGFKVVGQRPKYYADGGSAILYNY